MHSRYVLLFGFSLMTLIVNYGVLLDIYSSLPIGQLPLIKREHSAGLSIVAYAVGRMGADLLFVLFNAVVFTGEWVLC